jgi:glutamate racemase
MNKTPDSNRPIGIFDSGIGGLTVVNAVMKKLPHENIIYFGDTAHVPYGTKSDMAINRFSAEITQFLIRQDVKMILIACNSVSAVAKETVTSIAGSIPVLDVITAGTQAAIATGSKSIGVIGTLATIGSGAYEHSLRQSNNGLQIMSKACPLLVPLAEEGWTDNEVAKNTLSLYLSEFMNNNIDSIILGCTHYPLFTSTLQALFTNQAVTIIDSADSIADMAQKLLNSKKQMNSQMVEGTFKCYVSDRPQRFRELSERFLGRSVPDIQIVNLA